MEPGDLCRDRDCCDAILPGGSCGPDRGAASAMAEAATGAGMGQAINRLSARRVQTIAEPGRHADGGGLYLVVDANGSKRWVFKYKRGKKTYEMGLGGLASVPLARARECASECRAQVAS